MSFSRLRSACRSAIPIRSLCGALALLVTLLASGVAAGAVVSTSPDGLWQEIDKPAAGLSAVVAMTDHPTAYRVYQADLTVLGLTLARAPMERAVSLVSGGTVMTIPMPDGTYQRFRVVESPILSEELQAEHPELRTYMGQGLDDPNATARLDQTPAGFHAMVLSENGEMLVDPYSRGDTQRYVSFWKSDVALVPDFICQTEISVGGRRPPVLPLAPSGTQLRTYRLAVTATGEYTTFFGGIPQAQAHITTTMNRVDGIYERDLSIRMNIVFFNIYPDPATDPFPTGANVDGNLLNQNNTDLNAKVPGGSGGYDVGHILSQGGGGGLSSVGCVCTGSKGRGGTSLGDPEGDGFDVDFVAHEVGHEFGGVHSFNGTTGNCSGNRTGSDAYEPGSGTTVMSYAGICGAENVAPHSDPFFNTGSFDRMTAFRDAGGSCGPATATGNTPPNVNAGPDFTIPQNTPFRLTATGSDPDGDPLTFCWEQHDLGDPSPPPNNANGPLFRFPLPTTSPTRVCPKMSTVLSGIADKWEHLPTVDRDMNFRCTARDNRMGGGGVNYDDMVVHVSGSPFFVTSPNGGENLNAGCPTTVTWTVGGGNVAANVNILYSSNGGATFSTLLAGTPNDGSEAVTIPCGVTSQGRIMVEAVGNIFFDVSNANFSVSAGPPPSVAVNVVGGAVDASCQRVVTFTGTASDNCSLSAADVSVSVTLPSANATLGAPVIVKNQVDGQNVSVSGSVLVSNLAGPPATVQVAISAQDNCGTSGSNSNTAQVIDNTPPAIVCPAPLTVECSSHCGPMGGVPASDPAVVAFLNGATATDNCDPSPTVGAVSPPVCFPLGDTPVTFKATDAAGNSSTCSATVHVVDTTPPTIAVSLNRTVLWPPNHKLADIVATVTVTDVCDPNPICQLRSITSNEPDNGLGDGDTANDIQMDDTTTCDLAYQLRSERSGLGSGRKYTITYSGTDHSGNQALASVVVRVPHDQSGSAVAGDGWNNDGSDFATGAQTFAVVIRSIPQVVVDAGGDVGDLQLGGGATQPGATQLLFSARAVDEAQAFVGNSAGALSPVQTVRIDADGDGFPDLVCIYRVADARALAVASTTLDGPLGLHYNTRAGADYLVGSIFGLGTPIRLPNLGQPAVASGGRSAGNAANNGAPAGTDANARTAGAGGTLAPSTTELAGVYPNPVNQEANVVFSLARDANVDLTVYDVRGARVRTLRSGPLTPGRYTVAWNGRDDGGRKLTGGMYFVRFTAGRYAKTVKTAIMP